MNTAESVLIVSPGGALESALVAAVKRVWRGKFLAWKPGGGGENRDFTLSVTEKPDGASASLCDLTYLRVRGLLGITIQYYMLLNRRGGVLNGHVAPEFP